MELLTLHQPYPKATSIYELIEMMKNILPDRTPHPDNPLSGECVDLLERLLRVDPESRISFEEFELHAFIGKPKDDEAIV